MSRWHTPKPTGRCHDRPRHPHQTEENRSGMVMGSVAALVRARESPDQEGPGSVRGHRAWPASGLLLGYRGVMADRCTGEGAQRQVGGESTIAMPMATVTIMPSVRPSQAQYAQAMTITQRPNVTKLCEQGTVLVERGVRHAIIIGRVSCWSTPIAMQGRNTPSGERSACPVRAEARRRRPERPIHQLKAHMPSMLRQWMRKCRSPSYIDISVIFEAGIPTQ